MREKGVGSKREKVISTIIDAIKVCLNVERVLYGSPGVNKAYMSVCITTDLCFASAFFLSSSAMLSANASLKAILPFSISACFNLLFSALSAITASHEANAS